MWEGKQHGHVSLTWFAACRSETERLAGAPSGPVTAASWREGGENGGVRGGEGEEQDYK